MTQHGLPTITLTRLVRAGKLERVARGRYGAPGAKTSEHRSLPEPRLNQPAIRVVPMADGARADGVERRTIDGVEVPGFNAARTVVAPTEN